MMQRIVDAFTKWLPWSPTLRVVLLGVEYDTSDEEAREQFLADFGSRIQFTYRSGFAPLALVNGKEIRSDSGWGCMLRVMQMILAQALAAFVLGRGWRYEATRDLAPGSPYLKLIECFLDTPGAPFSLHSLVTTGQRLLGKEPSTWFGPTSAARSAGQLFDAAAVAEEGSQHVPDFLRRFGCCVFDDGAIYRQTVLEEFSRGREAVLLLVCRRLGLDEFNAEVYRPGLEACFGLPEFQGLASGNSGSSAHFFVGVHDDSLLFLDPHSTQPALERLPEDDAAAQGLRPSRPLPLRWTRLNPSVCLGFLVRSSEEFTGLCAKLSEGPFGEVFEILEREPSYAARACEVVSGTADDDEIVLVE